jgi:hypothetical protein
VAKANVTVVIKVAWWVWPVMLVAMAACKITGRHDFPWFDALLEKGLRVETT